MSELSYDSMKLLERVFAAEVENRLPFQTKARGIYTLEGQGMVERLKVTMSGCTVEGWQLTHPGRYHYCTWASEKVKRQSAAPGQGEKK